ncbi:MAG: tetratricopeptide repeat protein [Anaerolineales bacterium]|nr:tetratricopeptide repeat protein [Anaerolineales bacterium]MCS7247501.1 tetratricopeptide repeat protein [Anaerolineales bacterium]MDW8161312.1 tetratricopeptide repeat protein [Anaerolineales bacterium]MDW8448116.1 tetratricopeptide repeat protein [Anaerolineales bacterium]
MYLRGSKWSVRRRPRRRSNPFLIAVLLAMIGVALYFNQVVVPATPPLFIPTPTPTRSPESYLNEAEQLFREGRLLQAIEAYKQALIVDPYNVSIYVTLARLQVFAGEYEEAITNAQNALLKNPNNALAHAVLGWAQGFTGDYLSAEASLKRALELDPNSALAHAYYAEVLINKGQIDDLDKAIEESRIAMQLDSSLLEARRARGIVLLSTGRENLDAAIEELKAAIAINPKIADLHLYLGYAYRLKGENDLAVEELLTAYSLNPKDWTPLAEISLAYANIGQYGKASQYAEQAMKVEPSNPKLHGNLGIMYYRNGEFSKAVRELELAVRGGTMEDGTVVEGMPLDYGTAAQIYWFYGFALARTNRCGEAVQVFQTLLSGVPDDPLAVENAKAGIELCLELTGKSTPQPTITPTPE